PPKVAQRMRNEWIIDRIAREIFLTEWHIDSANSEIYELRVGIETQWVFKVQVQFTHPKRISPLVTCDDVQFRKEVEIVPNRRLNEQLRFINAKLGVSKLPAAPA